MTETKGRKTLSQLRREADERVRLKNIRDRGISNVVPLHPPKPRAPFRWPAMPSNPLVLWAGILLVLIAAYFVQLAF